MATWSSQRRSISPQDNVAILCCCAEPRGDLNRRIDQGYICTAFSVQCSSALPQYWSRHIPFLYGNAGTYVWVRARVRECVRTTLISRYGTTVDGSGDAWYSSRNSESLILSTFRCNLPCLPQSWWITEDITYRFHLSDQLRRLTSLS